MRFHKIQTDIYEIYLKLPALNYSNEVIFSEDVPEIALDRILAGFRRKGIAMDKVKINNKTALIKRGDIRFNTYLLDR